MKHPVRGFRLSPDAVENLDHCMARTGMGQTWVVERALALYRESRPQKPFVARAEVDKLVEQAVMEARLHVARLEQDLHALSQKKLRAQRQRQRRQAQQTDQ